MRAQSGGTAQQQSDRDESRADWMELFFDLVFVALIGQLSTGLREHTSFGAALVFLALFATVWWSWVNLTYTINVQLGLSRRALAGYMLTAMAAVGAVAIAAPEAVGDRAWLFALGNAGLRCVMLALWARRTWAVSTGSRARILAYNGATALLWFASALVPAPACYALWAVAILCEIALLLASAPGMLSRVQTFRVEHLADRFGTLVIIALGESVLAIVVALSAAFTAQAAIVAGLSLVIAACLAWVMFMYGIDSMRSGLERLVAAGDSKGIIGTFAFLPYFLVAGVMLLSGALAIAIREPQQVLPAVSALSLSGGIVLFYAANTLIGLRYGLRRRFVLAWAVPSLLLPLAVLPLALGVAAGWAVAAMAAILVGLVIQAEWLGRHRTE